MAIEHLVTAPIAGNGSGGTSNPINTTGVNLLVVGASGFGGTSTTVKDSFNNEWTPQIDEFDASNIEIVVYTCLNPTVGPNHTFTLVGEFTSGAVDGFSGVKAVDQRTFNLPTGAGNSVNTGNITPSEDGSLIYALSITSGAPTDGSFAVDSGFTLTSAQNYVGGTAFGEAPAYLFQDSAATSKPIFSWNGTAGALGAAISFTPSPAPPTVYSVPDCRDYATFPNEFRTVQGTKIFDVQTSSNPAVPSADSRKNVPQDSRVSAPQNSRAPGTFGPNE